MLDLLVLPTADLLVPDGEGDVADAGDVGADLAALRFRLVGLAGSGRAAREGDRKGDAADCDRRQPGVSVIAVSLYREQF